MNAAEFTRDSIQKYGEIVAYQYQGREWTNVEHDADASEEELLARLHEYVTKYKLPQRIVFLDELPKNPNGKIDRKRMRADLNERA